MVETSNDPPLLDRICSKVHVSKSGLVGVPDQGSTAPLTDPPTRHYAGASIRSSTSGGKRSTITTIPSAADTQPAGHTSTVPPSPAQPPTTEDGHGETPAAIEGEGKPNIAIRLYQTTKEILTSSIINILLIFVPIGIAINFAGVNPTIVFALNAIAIIPLASLLSHATESVASTMGDTIGALLNVTFGNAVELIIFIALVKNEIRIVQASLLGSILANLLLILGMCFLFGGLRFREQTAFHASFTDNGIADLAVLKVSRGSSVVRNLRIAEDTLFDTGLDTVTGICALPPFPAKITRVHVPDMLNSSSSSDSSESSNDTDSDGSSGSNTTAKRIRRALRGRRRRKSNASSKETPSSPSARTPSAGTFHEPTSLQSPGEVISHRTLGAIASGDEADTDGEIDGSALRTRGSLTTYRDFESEKPQSSAKSRGTKSRKRRNKKHRKTDNLDEKEPIISEKATPVPEGPLEPQVSPASQRVTFVQDVQIMPDNSPKRPFNIRGISVLPTMPKMLTSTVFSAANPSGLTGSGPPVPVIVPRAPFGLRRTNSLPDRLNKTQSAPTTQPQAHLAPVTASSLSLHSDDSAKVKKYISRKAAVILLLISTALVAVCAEFLVANINYLVNHTSVSEAFIGLIILPIVGNAAEHVTAVTVASKNKMDLAIGVAVGSSIQIALFVTPVIVLLGWALEKDMSLYFSLFETISLFVSAFIVNFLVLDGRSNYLEGALLIAAYVIIAVAAFFYPDSSQQSSIGGAPSEMAMMF
ncbi:MAG: hypothetical protein Q9187_008285 [Circinaria calcarea]